MANDVELEGTLRKKHQIGFKEETNRTPKTWTYFDIFWPVVPLGLVYIQKDGVIYCKMDRKIKVTSAASSKTS